MPHRDLLLSPDHAVFVDGMLICVRQLVNGATIRQGDAAGPRSITTTWNWTGTPSCWPRGCTVESYLDTGNRAFFANSGAAPGAAPGPAQRRPDYPTRETGSCAPFVSDEANVRPVWRGLADRAAAIGRAVPVRVTTTDADPRLQCPDGRTIAPLHRDSDRVIFAAAAWRVGGPAGFPRAVAGRGPPLAE